MTDVRSRARESLGESSDQIHRRAFEILSSAGAHGALAIDVGCGTGGMRAGLSSLCGRYLGVDVVKHSGFPTEAEFMESDLDAGRINLPDGAADVVVSLETIEHLENPRAFIRELKRVARPGGWVLISTPNQLSVLSKLTLVLKNRFNAFQERDYPAHITALLETDLLRISKECGLRDARVEYSERGRLPLSAMHYPRAWSQAWPRALSDNLLLLTRA